MKRFLFGLMLIAVAGSTLAQEPTDQLRRVPGPPATVADMVAQLATIHSVRPAGRAETYQGGLIIGAVVNAPGKFGTNYTTAFFAENERNVPQEVLIKFLPQGVSAGPADRITLQPHLAYVDPNILESLHKTGVGSLLITAVLPGTNMIDPNGDILAFVRIVTPEPGTSAGTTSFSEEAVPSNSITGPGSATTIGVLQDAFNRANAGVVNPTNSPLTILGIVVGAGTTPFTMSIPPLSMQYVALPSNLSPSSTGYYSVIFDPQSNFTGNYFAFNIGANDQSGDGYFVRAVQWGPGD